MVPRSKGAQKGDGDLPGRVIGAIIDITEEKVMLEKLQESAARLDLAEDSGGIRSLGGGSRSPAP